MPLDLRVHYHYNLAIDLFPYYVNSFLNALNLNPFLHHQIMHDPKLHKGEFFVYDLK